VTRSDRTARVAIDPPYMSGQRRAARPTARDVDRTRDEFSRGKMSNFSPRNALACPWMSTIN
jgi:hypothetical protein